MRIFAIFASTLVFAACGSSQNTEEPVAPVTEEGQTCRTVATKAGPTEVCE